MTSKKFVFKEPKIQEKQLMYDKQLPYTMPNAFHLPVLLYNFAVTNHLSSPFNNFISHNLILCKKYESFSTGLFYGIVQNIDNSRIETAKYIKKPNICFDE
jgi:hypothetical protein